MIRGIIASGKVREDMDRLFITTWKTDNPGTTNNTTIRIPTLGGGYNYDVDWGDGSGWKLGYNGDAEYDYGIAGTYTIKIRGDFPTIVLYGSGEEAKILSIEQWGGIQWDILQSSFRGCINLTGDNITDVPDLSNVTNTIYMFYDTPTFNSDLSGWDVSNVTNMGYMLSNASSFNSDLSSWDVSNVTDMRYMFRNASSFNSDLSSWDVSNVTNMVSVFQDASSFNSDLSSWDVSNATNMSYMFQDASSFNSDLSGWNVSNATNMRSMFYNATSFNSDLSGWNVSNVTDIVLFLYGVTMSTENYSNTLIGWSNNPNGLKPNLSFHGGNSKYNAQGAIARQKIIDDYGWTIVDGGPE